MGKNKGCRVGVTTSVSVDHATPAAFYAHDPSRGSYYKIGTDLYKAGFDFYAGSDFLDPTNKEDKSGTSETCTVWQKRMAIPLPEVTRIT